MGTNNKNNDKQLNEKTLKGTKSIKFLFTSQSTKKRLSNHINNPFYALLILLTSKGSEFETPAM